jgi:hypothetical protein
MKTPAELSPMAGAPVCAPIGESRSIQAEQSAQVKQKPQPGCASRPGLSFGGGSQDLREAP